MGVLSLASLSFLGFMTAFFKDEDRLPSVPAFVLALAADLVVIQALFSATIALLFKAGIYAGSEKCKRVLSTFSDKDTFKTLVSTTHADLLKL